MIFSFNKNYNNKLIDYSLALFLATLPLPFAIINCSFALFLVATLISFRKENAKLNYYLILPIVYYVLCIASLFWSRDIHESTKYLSKGLFFIAIPIIFQVIPKLDFKRRTSILTYYSYAMVIASIFYIARAIIRYITTADISHFFYHHLVTLEVNAIYVSLFISLALIQLLSQASKKFYDYISLGILLVFLILLSSKNVLIITFIGIGIYLLKNYKLIHKKYFIVALLVGILAMIPLSSKIYERFKIEFVDSSENIVLENGTINVSIKNAWQQDKFSPNYYFNGSAFRIYQFRIFTEMMNENNKFLTGFGAATVQPKIKEKQVEHKLYEDYGNLNFHNQYLQSFACLGIIGLLLTIGMNISNWVNSIKYKDFVFLFFTILTTSIMFTESLFERQRGIVFFVILYCLFQHTIHQKRATH